MAKRKDRRVARTQQQIRAALLALIQEKGFEALTVQEIVDRADVGRTTFYAHFDGKDDLLASGFEDLRLSLKARQRDAHGRGTSPEDRAFGYAREVFAHTGAHRDVFRAMVGRRSGAAVQRILHRLLVELVRDDVKVAGPRSAGTAVPAEALVQFLAGAMFALVMWWLEGKARPPIDDVEALFRRLAVPALAAARG